MRRLWNAGVVRPENRTIHLFRCGCEGDAKRKREESVTASKPGAAPHPSYFMTMATNSTLHIFLRDENGFSNLLDKVYSFVALLARRMKWISMRKPIHSMPLARRMLHSAAQMYQLLQRLLMLVEMPNTYLLASVLCQQVLIGVEVVVA